MSAKVAILATWDTKGRELAQLEQIFIQANLYPVRVDLSTNIASSASKCEHMNRVVASLVPRLKKLQDECCAFVAVGGGTGAEMGLALLRHLAPLIPKFLLTPVTFDPRVATSGMLITCLFSPIDIKGASGMLHQVFENLVRQVSSSRHEIPRATANGPHVKPGPNLAISALGVTEPAINSILFALGSAQNRASIFHANGFGGVALGRLIKEREFDFLIDVTPHELTRHLIGGAHAPLEGRLRAMQTCPSIALPGGLNFVSLSPENAGKAEFDKRRRFKHSAAFTHLCLTENEMVRVATEWANILNSADRPPQVIIPMGGFSTQDRPGGCLENPRLREICLQVLESERQNFHLHPIEAHIGDQETAKCVARMFFEWSATEFGAYPTAVSHQINC